MGHYASEMDPHWGQPTASERRLAEVDDERVRALASTLLKGFNTGSLLDNLNAESGVKVAEAIDELIQARVEEALGATVLQDGYVDYDNGEAAFVPGDEEPSS